MTGRRLGIIGIALTLAGVVLIGVGATLEGSPVTGGLSLPNGIGMMGGTGMMGGAWGAGSTSPGPGEAGFVAGTPTAPRVVRVVATPALRFVPDTIRVQAGETISFDVTTMGPATHEFMLGPAADVAADKDGTPEIANLAMMQTASLTYTFSGSGPFAYACHAPGHYEAGMAGTIVVVG